MSDIVSFSPDKFQQILTTEQLAHEYGVSPHSLIVAATRHKARFHEGRDYQLVEGGQLKEAKTDGMQSQVGKRASKVYLWTKHGAFIHATLIDDDKVWDAYENYFQSPTVQLPAQVKAFIAAQQEKIKELTTLLIAQGEVPNLPATSINGVLASEIETALFRLRQLIKPMKEYAERMQKKKAIYLSPEDAAQLVSALRSMHENLNTIYVQSEKQQAVMDNLDVHSILQTSLLQRIQNVLVPPVTQEQALLD